MADIHAVIRNIRSGNQLPENLKLYLNLTLEASFSYAEASLPLEFLTLIDSYRDLIGETGSAGLCSEVLDILEEVNELLSLSAEKGCVPEASGIAALRKRNISFMEKTTDAADVFLCCEYILNRLEHRYTGAKELPAGYSDLSYTDTILERLSRLPGEEKNLLIAELFRQLPFRTTKQKFYDALSERLTIYKESDRASLCAMIDLLRSAAGLRISADTELFPELFEVRDALYSADLKNLTKTEYDKLSEELLYAGNALNRNSDFGNQLQRVLNQLLILSLSSVSGEAFSGQSVSWEILKKALDNDTETAFGLCSQLEGIPEEMSERFREATGLFRDFEEKYPELIGSDDTARLADALRKTMRLLSDSDYASLSGEETDTSPVDENFFREAVSAFLLELSSHASGLGRMSLRAEMAHINGILPPRFASEEALREYIYESLRSCTDTAEKLGCIDIIDQLFAEQTEPAFG